MSMSFRKDLLQPIAVHNFDEWFMRAIPGSKTGTDDFGEAKQDRR